MDDKANPGVDTQVDVLTEQIEQLIDTCGRLRSENQQLFTEKNTLTQDREELLGRNREAKLRIDRVVERLRELDAG